MSNKFLWDDCKSIEQQRARVFRRWLADPEGTYNDRWDNLRLVKLAIEYWVEPLLRQSGNTSLDGYWSDGVVYLECANLVITDLQFSGVLVISERQIKRGLAPFELGIQYESERDDAPTAVRLRLGERDADSPLSLATHEGPNRSLTAIDVYSRRPTADVEWAINLAFAPYIA